MTLPDQDPIHRRGRALEEAFFAERDRQLLDAMRRRYTADEAEQLLAAATGVSDQIVIRELANLPVPHFLAVLGIFPLVEVAWCDGSISPEERRAVLDAAADLGVAPGSQAHQLLDRWLEQRPADNAIDLWKDYARAICATLDPGMVAKVKDGVMGRAKKIAMAAGGILGFGNRISPVEQDCLDDLAKAFEPAATKS